MKYLITGGTGFIGTNVCKSLAHDELIVFTRNIYRAERYFSAQGINNVRCIDELATFSDTVDVIINLAGRGIFDKRWSDSYKQQLINSRIDTTRALSDYIARIQVKPQVCISASAVGIYGEQLTPVGEEGTQGSGFAAELCQSWEAEAQRITAQGVRTCIMRLGVVIGNGGMLTKTLPSVKFGMGAYFGDGAMAMPWVHIDDVVKVIVHLIKENESGVYNVVAPEIITNKQFMDTLASTIRRKIRMHMPRKVLHILFGEGANEVLLSSQHLVPSRLLNAKYVFQHPTIKSALHNTIGTTY